MVKRKAKYTEDERAAAVEMYLSGPESIPAVAKALGVSPSSLNYWLQIHRAAHPEDTR